MNGRQLKVDRQLGITEKCDYKRDVRDDVADLWDAVTTKPLSIST